MIILLLVLNFAISIFNSWSVGRGWAESKCAGGWVRFMAWAGAVMASSGFTWCYLVIIGTIAHLTGKLPAKYLDGFFALGYLVIILPILGSGLALMVDSWAYFWRRRTFADGAVAGWNTFAQVFNTVEAMRGVPKALEVVIDMFKGDDDEDSSPLTALVLLLVFLAVAGGILTAAGIIRITARNHAFNVRADHILRREVA